jgi:hypothetical protein
MTDVELESINQSINQLKREAVYVCNLVKISILLPFPLYISGHGQVCKYVPRVGHFCKYIPDQGNFGGSLE